MADVSTSGVLNALWDGVTPVTAPAGSVVGPIQVGRDSTVGVDVRGTFTATVTLELSIDGSNWYAATATTTAGAGTTNTFTAPGDKLVSTSGASLIRARCSVYTSGAATVVMAGTPGGGGGGGGGASGAVTIADGADVAEGSTADAGVITDTTGTTIGFLRGLIKQSITLLTRLPAALTGSGNLKAAIVETTVTQPVSGTVTITPSGTQTVSGTVTANQGGTWTVQPGNTANTTAWKVDGSAVTQPISAASLPLPATAATDRATAAAPGSVELSDGAAFYTAAKTGQLPAALVGSRLDVNVGRIPATISTVNSSTATLANAAVFTGTSEDVSGYNSVSVNVFADQSSAANGLSLQWSSNGTNWDLTNTYTVTLNAGQTIVLPPRAQFFRLVYTNGAVTQTAFRLQTIFHQTDVSGDVGTAAMQVQGTAANGATGVGNPVPVAIFDNVGTARVPFTAYGDSLTSNQILAVVPAYANSIGGASVDRARNNLDVTLLASAARTTTQTSADITTYNLGAIIVVLDMTTVGTASVTVSIDGKDVTSGKYYNLLTGAAITTNSTNVYTVDPMIPAVANVTAQKRLPRTIRIVVTANNANSGTYSCGYSLQVT